MRKRGGLLHFCSLSYSHFIPSQPASLGSGCSHTCSCSHWVYFLELTSKDAIDGYEVLRGIESAVERASWGPLILSRLPPCDLSLLVTVTFLSKRSNFLQDDSQNHSGLLSLLLSVMVIISRRTPREVEPKSSSSGVKSNCRFTEGLWMVDSELQIFLRGEGRRASAPGGWGGKEGTQGLQSTNPLRTPTAPRARKP